VNFQKWEKYLLIGIVVVVLAVEALLIRSFLPAVIHDSGSGPVLRHLWFSGASFLTVIVGFIATIFVGVSADKQREKVLKDRLDRWVRR
jgi:hypothetical protein